MDDSKLNNPINGQEPDRSDQHLSGHELEFERLMTRIVDDEASLGDLRQFELIADRDPMLWKRLSLRQGDMLRLSANIDRQMHSFELMELPELHGENSRTFSTLRTRLPVLSAAVGWAAVFIMAVIWGTTTLRDADRFDRQRALPAAQSPAEISADEHMREYLRAPWVMGEMPPSLLQVDELSDGRKALRILRRIEEVTFIDPEAEIPITDDGHLSKPLSELRSAESAPELHLHD